MIIKELKNKTITLELDYNEMRDISNALYYLNEQEKESSDYDTISIKDTARDALIAFDIIKHGTVTQFTIGKYAEKYCPSDCKGVVKDEGI